MQNKLLDHLHQLKLDTTAWEALTAEYAVPKEHTAENFKIGVKRFIALANMSPEERERFYGSRFAGLYDNKDLAQLWNAQCSPEQTITPHSIDDFKPASWQIIFADGVIALQYRGTQPSKAFNQLLLGAIIDCGMFCQLGIWFGIRYMLGDAAFDQHFARTPVLLTRFLYEGPEQGQKHLTNPLFDFFSTEPLQSGVAIEHLFNDVTYYYKHPGGNASGHNALIIDDEYDIFHPLRSKAPMQRSDVYSDLVEMYNQAPDAHDAEALEAFQDNIDLFESCYGSIYYFPGSAFAWINSLRNDQSVLISYATELDNLPQCRDLMQEVFAEHPDWKKGFYDAVLCDPATHRFIFEALYKDECIKETFETWLENHPNVLNDYYEEVLKLLRIHHNSMRETTLKIDTLDDNLDSQHGDIPSKLYFDFSKLLNVLNEAQTRRENARWYILSRPNMAPTSNNTPPLKRSFAFFSPNESTGNSGEVTSNLDDDPDQLITLPKKSRTNPNNIFQNPIASTTTPDDNHAEDNVSSITAGLSGSSEKN